MIWGSRDGSKSTSFLSEEHAPAPGLSAGRNEADWPARPRSGKTEPSQKPRGSEGPRLRGASERRLVRRERKERPYGSQRPSRLRIGCEQRVHGRQHPQGGKEARHRHDRHRPPAGLLQNQPGEDYLNLRSLDLENFPVKVPESEVHL